RGVSKSLPPRKRGMIQKYGSAARGACFEAQHEGAWWKLVRDMAAAPQSGSANSIRSFAMTIWPEELLRTPAIHFGGGYAGPVERRKITVSVTRRGDPCGRPLTGHQEVGGHEGRPYDDCAFNRSSRTVTVTFVVDQNGYLTTPILHDGFVDGVQLTGDKSAAVALRTIHGERFSMQMIGLEALACD